MLSSSVISSKPISTFFFSPFPSSSHPLNYPHKTLLPKPISATIIPSSNPPQQKKLYQPFRPPPSLSPIPPQFRNLDTAARLDVLTNRLGLWFEYAPLIPSLIQEGFDPSTLEELTGLTGVDQNRLVVAAKVRESLVQLGADADMLEFFDKGGAELLYEIRLLSVNQRVAAARYLLDKKSDPNDALELAKAIKDFPRRRGDRGWEWFDYTIPGDCLAFMYYRQALENRDSELKESVMEKALNVAVSERARGWVTKELDGNDGGGEGEGRMGGIVDGVKVPVVRLNLGEIAESTIVSVLPVCGAEERAKGVEAAPWECGCKGDFGIVEAEKEWRRWVVLPAWEPVAGLKRGGVVVVFSDARALPWRVNRWYKEEAILVVASRGQKDVAADDGFYLVLDEDDQLKVERGLTLKEKGVKESLGTVVIVIRPPREDTENEFADEDWE